MRTNLSTAYADFSALAHTHRCTGAYDPRSTVFWIQKPSAYEPAIAVQAPADSDTNWTVTLYTDLDRAERAGFQDGSKEEALLLVKAYMDLLPYLKIIPDEMPECSWCGAQENGSDGDLVEQADGDVYHVRCWTNFQNAMRALSARNMEANR